MYPTLIGFGLLMIYYNLGRGSTQCIFDDMQSRSTSKSGMTAMFTEREKMLDIHNENLSISGNRDSTESDDKIKVMYPTSENERRAASHVAEAEYSVKSKSISNKFLSFSNSQ